MLFGCVKVGGNTGVAPVGGNNPHNGTGSELGSSGNEDLAHGF